MKNTIKVYGVKQGREIKHIPRKRLGDLLEQLKDGDIELTIKRRGKRSNPQNRYYWSCIVEEIRIEFTNRGIYMDSEQVHEFLKAHFNKQYIHDEQGEVIGEYGGSTTQMNKEQMSDYIERIIQWCAEKLEITISPPGTQTQLFQAA
jgi:hypothetical protein